MKQGRRQKPCNRTGHFPLRLWLKNDPRFPVAVLLRSAISEEENSKNSSGLGGRSRRPLVY